MQCTKCQFTLADNQRFCPECGTQRQKTCPACHAEYEANHKFCGKCGTPLDGGSIPAASRVEQPEHLPIQPIVDNTHFEPVLRHVSILFADIKGSTAAISELDPEDARNTLRPVVEIMLSAIYQYNGTVIHTAGDGIVAIFGAPQSYEDHALRACLAACLMQAQLHSLTGGLKIRVGLSTGEILMDIVGTRSKRIEYDISGAAVNLAARMEQSATPGSILITKSTFVLVEEIVRVKPVVKLEVKGFSEAVEAYELIGLKDENNLIAIKYRPSFIPFVGRDDIMLELNKLLQLATSGHGNMVSLEAEAGQGKSRIISELLTGAESSDLQVIYGGGFSHTNHITLFPIIQIFRKILDIKADDSLVDIEKKIIPFIENAKTPQAASAALSLLNVTHQSSAWNKLDTNIKHQYVFSVGMEILKQVSLKTPLVLILEDLHWVDEESEAFIDYLLSQIGELPILLLSTYRPGYHDKRLKQVNYTAIKIGPIADEQLKMVLDIILGIHPSILTLKNDILHAAAGNPFFMQEMISSLVQDQVLIGNMGNYHLSTEKLASKIKLPESIFALLQTKIDKLPAEQKELLQTAAVAGERFLYALIEKLSETEISITRLNLNKLTDAHFVFEVQLYPELEFSFDHALIQEVLYSTLLKSVRNKIHLKILELLEKLPKDKLEEKIEILATHAYAGQDWQKAFHYCSRAAEKGFVLNTLKSAIQYCKQAVDAAAHIEDQSTIIDKLILVHMDMGHAFLHLGLPIEQAAQCDIASQLAIESNNIELQSLTNSFQCASKLGLGHAAEALPYATQAYQQALQIKSEPLLHLAEFMLLHCYFFAGDYEKAAQVGMTLLTTTPDIHYYIKIFRLDINVIAILFVVMAQVNLGKFSIIEERTPLYLSAIDEMEQSSVTSTFVLAALGIAHVQQGDYSPQVESYLKTASQHCFDIKMIILLPVIDAALACLYFRTNRGEEGLKLLNHAIDTAEQIHFSFTAIASLSFISEGLLLSGQLDKAKDFTVNALQISEKRGLQGNIAMLTRILADIEMSLPAPDKALIQKLLENALQSAQALSMAPLEMYCRLALAKL